MLDYFLNRIKRDIRQFWGIRIMAWLFERTVECAAWVAMISAWASLCVAIKWLIDWFGTLQTGGNPGLVQNAGIAAGAFVGFSVALGVLACVDRFLFDADEQPRS